MAKIEGWQTYDNPPGARYALTLVNPSGAKPTDSGMSIIRQNLDARPAVDVASVKADSRNNIRAVVMVFKNGTLGGILGAYHNDGDHFWQIAEVDRTDDGANVVSATAARVFDVLTDPFDRFAEEAKRTASDTGDTLVRKGLPTLLLAGGAFLAFTWWTR